MSPLEERSHPVERPNKQRGGGWVPQPSLSSEKTDRQPEGGDVLALEKKNRRAESAEAERKHRWLVVPRDLGYRTGA